MVCGIYKMFPRNFEMKDRTFSLQKDEALCGWFIKRKAFAAPS
jgi:hypothetical protein